MLPARTDYTSMAVVYNMRVSDDNEADCNEIGVLYCCGNRLIWRAENIDDIMETSCEKCGTNYAMSLNNDEEPEEGWRDWTDWRDVA